MKQYQQLLMILNKVMFVKKKKKGFTLIELLVTLAVIAIITTITFVVINNVNNNSNEVVMEVNKESLSKAAITYVQEFKMNEWELDVEGNEFVCISVNQLKNKGYFKGKLEDENGNSLDDTTLKVTRDANKVISNEVTKDSDDCNVQPKVEIEVNGLTKTYNSEDWYYNKETVMVIFTLNNEINYFEYSEITVGGQSVKNKLNLIESSKNNYKYKLQLGDIDGLGADTVIYAKIKFKGKEDIATSTINIDFTKPSKPLLTSSDGLISGKWHAEEFILNISGGDNSPSGNFYRYTTDLINYTKLESNQLLVTKSNVTYYVESCNNLEVCGDSEPYTSKIDKTKPTIISFTKNTESFAKSLTLTAKIKDTESGIVKYKISKESNRPTSGWTTISATTNEKIYTYNVTENGTYYVWVEDAVGNYNSSSIVVNNIDATSPQKPILTASDNILTGQLHSNDFDLNVSGGGTSPSGIYYLYKINGSTEQKVMSNKIRITKNTSNTIEVKTCNNVGTCSGYSTYTTKKTATFVSDKISAKIYFTEDSTGHKDVRFSDIEILDNNLKVNKYYYLIKRGESDCSTTEEFSENNIFYDNMIGKKAGYWYGWIKVVDVNGNEYIEYIGYARRQRKGMINTSASPSLSSVIEETWTYNDATPGDFYKTIVTDVNDNNKKLTNVTQTINGNKITVKVSGGKMTNTPYTYSSKIYSKTLIGYEPTGGYTCPNGGKLKNYKCVEPDPSSWEFCNASNCTSKIVNTIPDLKTGKNSYDIVTTYTNVTCTCAYSGATPGILNSTISPAGSCPRGYTMPVPGSSTSNTCPPCNSSGNYSGKQLEGLARCQWNGNYDAVYSTTGTTAVYECASGLIEYNDYCYQCRHGGDFITSTQECVVQDYDYSYNAYVSYFVGG